MQKNQSKSLTFQYKVRKAIKILTENVESIPDVQSWAREAGVSRRWLCNSMKKVYGKPPKVFLRNTRYKLLIKYLEDNPELSGYFLAREVGLSDEKALYKFLSRHYSTTLTQLRNEIIKARLDV